MTQNPIGAVCAFEAFLASEAFRSKQYVRCLCADRITATSDTGCSGSCDPKAGAWNDYNGSGNSYNVGMATLGLGMATMDLGIVYNVGIAKVGLGMLQWVWE